MTTTGVINMQRVVPFAALDSEIRAYREADGRAIVVVRERDCIRNIDRVLETDALPISGEVNKSAATDSVVLGHALAATAARRAVPAI